MSNEYAILNADARVLRVEASDAQPPDLEEGVTAVEVQGWDGWPVPPHDGLVLAYRNGQFVWDDPRSLAQAQADQIAVLTDAYQTAIAQPVPFTTATGVAQMFQADADSIYNCTAAMLGCQGAQATPAGFYWLAQDNTQVPFTYADLQGLAAAFLAQGAPAFAKLQSLKTAVRAATTVEAVKAQAW